jgi:hypothetical protein
MPIDPTTVPTRRVKHQAIAAWCAWLDCAQAERVTPRDTDGRVEVVDAIYAKGVARAVGGAEIKIGERRVARPSAARIVGRQMGRNRRTGQLNPGLYGD